MKKMVVLMAFIFILSFPKISSAKTFTVVNHTGVDIYELYVSAYHRNIWGQDLLHGRILRSNQSLRVFWETNNRDWWDMQGFGGQGEYFLWVGIELKEKVKITLNPRDARSEGLPSQ